MPANAEHPGRRGPVAAQLEALLVAFCVSINLAF